MATRRWQFTLGGLLVAVSLIGAVVAFYFKTVRSRQHFVETSARLANKLHINDHLAPRYAHDVVMHGQSLTDWDLHILAELGRIERLHLEIDSDSVTDAGIRFVSQLSGLRTLELENTLSEPDLRITANSFRCLADAPNLQEMSLIGLPVTNELIRNAGRLSQLKSLMVDCRNNTPVEFRDGFPSLQELRIERPREGVVVQSLPQLRTLDIGPHLLDPDEDHISKSLSLVDLPQLEHLTIRLDSERL